MTDRPTRVLWTSNIVLPAVAADLGLPLTSFGGWLSLMIEKLATHPGFTVGVAMRSEVPFLKRIEKGNISYFAVPQRRRDRYDVTQQDCERVLADFEPDILHAEGAEMRHARRFLSTWRGARLLSMQGVINGYQPYELGCLDIPAMLSPRHPCIAITGLVLLANKRFRFGPRLRHERAAMTMTNHVMGRTLWDRAQAAGLSPDATYHYCPRILRDVFYETHWRSDSCKRHSILIGNAAAPRKGAHIALRALALLKRDYPNAILYIAGEDPSRLPMSSLKRHIGYPVYLSQLIKQLGLEANVRFTGLLDAGGMAELMANTHVYLMSSLIENSPNTLGEAMILGMPIVSAYAGGAPSMAADELEALFYRADDPTMLALQIHRIFEDDSLAARLAAAARSRALVTHAPDRNLAMLVAAYEAIMAEYKSTS